VEPVTCRAWNGTSGSRTMHEILASGYAAQPPPVESQTSKRRGRPKQSAAKNLLDDLLKRADQVLAFLDDPSLPFSNNLAERDLRMVKVQQKIAGTFRSDAGATSFCRIRSYLSTMHQQGHAMLVALAAVFAGKPFPVAWGS
jgi:transposase